ncbi:hypothetical protein FAIPA1_70045 [Frankia sp. AiPs1]
MWDGRDLHHQLVNLPDSSWAGAGQPGMDRAFHPARHPSHQVHVTQRKDELTKSNISTTVKAGIHEPLRFSQFGQWRIGPT